MRKLLATLLILSASFAAAQISGVGQLGCNGSPVTGTVWNSGTALNATQILAGPTAASGATVVLDQTSTLTLGAVTFQADYGDGTFVTLPANQLNDPGTQAPIANPYTLQASTNKLFFVSLHGIYRLQLKLTTAITGTATVTPYTTLWCNGVVNAPVNQVEVNGTVVDTNSGTKSAGTQRVVIATDQPALTNKLLVTPDAGVESPNVATATTTNAGAACWFTSAASNNSTSCKGSAGNLYSVFLVNTTATLYYLRLYNLASAPTCTSATGFLQSIPVPASTSGAGFTFTPAVPIAFSTGIGFCFTGASASTDNTNAATGVFGVLEYK
jgi:hypothetical protein